MAKRKIMVCFDSAEDFARHLGATEAEVELISMKGTLLALLDKERERRGMNNTEFAKFLGIPKSRWSGVYSGPSKVTLDYMLMLAAKCGVLFELTRKAA